MKDLNIKVNILTRAKSFIFTPGNRPDRFERALSANADVIILDLDASVMPEQKALARRQILDFLRSVPTPEKFIVRTNALGSTWAVDELKQLANTQISGVLLPMVEKAEHARLAHSLLNNRLPIISLVETARGISNIRDICQNGDSCRIAFGNMDYETDVDLGGDRWGLIYPSSQVVIESRCAGLPPPIAGVTANFKEPKVLLDDIQFERSLGFGAKLCIHPVQVNAINTAFSPTEEEFARAQRIVDAGANSYAINLDGEMVDRPVIERALRTLALKR